VDPGLESSDPRVLLRIQVETLFTCDARGRMLRVNEPDGKPAPRFFLGRSASGKVWRFRHDIDEALVVVLEDACRAERAGEKFLTPPYGVARYEEILAGAAPVRHVSTGPVYRFPAWKDWKERPEDGEGRGVLVTEANAHLLHPHLDAWLGDVPTRQPMVAVVVGGSAVSLCASVRIGTEAHEAGVDTAPEFRGRGYAAVAVNAWARAVRELGVIPLYSTSWSNAASQAVARKLGLLRFGSDLHIE
jgi:RimJ/RimL family protein N-acetyltransferase